MSDLFTVKDLADMFETRFPVIDRHLRDSELEPKHKKGMLRFYDQDAVDFLEECVER